IRPGMEVNPAKCSDAYPKTAPNRQAQDGNDHQIGQQVGEDDPPAVNRLRHEQLHRAAIDFAGNRSGGPADSPDAQNRLQEWMEQSDREDIAGVAQIDQVPTQDRLNELPWPLEKNIQEHFQRNVLGYCGQNLLGESRGYPCPQAFVQCQQGAYGNE